MAHKLFSSRFRLFAEEDNYHAAVFDIRRVFNTITIVFTEGTDIAWSFFLIRFSNCLEKNIRWT